MTLESEFPSDERVEKEISSLQKAGFEVSIATYTFSDRKEEEAYHGYTIFRKKIPVWLYKSSAASLILPFYFLFWHRYLDGILKKGGFGFIHVHDLPLSGTASKLARKYGLKLICDQHEFYSNWIVRTKHYNTFIGKIIKLLSPWDRYEKKCLSMADRVVTVSEPLRELYIKALGLNPAKVVNLPNTTELSVFNMQNVDDSIRLKYKNRFVLFYAGGLDHLRGIEFICQAVSELKKQIPEVLFLLAGKENRTFSLDEVLQRNAIREHVDFVGWIPRTGLASYLASAQVCLFLPRADNEEINNTIVTKIYQYTALGKPIVVSEARMMKEFVECNKLGFSVTHGDVGQLCTVIRKIHDEPQLSDEIEKHAAAVLPLISWEETSRDFVGNYLEMANLHA
jgi:glycosyltransferase involved in cell wall biosynthesis